MTYLKVHNLPRRIRRRLWKQSNLPWSEFRVGPDTMRQVRAQKEAASRLHQLESRRKASQEPQETRQEVFTPTETPGKGWVKSGFRRLLRRFERGGRQ